MNYIAIGSVKKCVTVAYIMLTDSLRSDGRVPTKSSVSSRVLVSSKQNLENGNLHIFCKLVLFN